LITTLFLTPSGSESILIRETEFVNSKRWIAALLKSFPPKCVNPLSYTTFLFDPNKSKHINATNGTTKVIFDKNAVSYKFNFFDQTDIRRSVITSRVNNALSGNSPYLEYANVIVDRLLHAPEKLDSFFNYANLFNFSALTPELNILNQIFSIYDKDNFNFSNNEITTIMQFLVKYGTKRSLDLIMDKLTKLTGQLKESPNVNDWFTLIDFYIIIINQYDNDSYLPILSKLYLDLYDTFVIARQTSYTEINAKKRYVTTALEQRSDTFIKNISSGFISGAHLDFIRKKSKYLSPESIKAIVNDLFNAKNSLNFTTRLFFENPDISLTLKTLLFDSPDRIKNLDWFFDAFKKNDQDLLNSILFLIRMVDENDTSFKNDDILKSIGSNLADILFNNPNRFNFINNLLTQNLNNNFIPFAVLSEWVHNIKKFDSAEEKISAYQMYEKNLIDNLKYLPNDIVKYLLNSIVPVFLDILPDDLRVSQSINWLISDVKDLLNNNNLFLLSSKASPHVSFDPSDNVSENLFSTIYKLYNEKDFTKFPNHGSIRDRLYFRYAASRALSSSPIIDRNLQAELYDIDENTYAEFSNVVFNRVFTIASNPKDHRFLIQTFLSPNHIDSFKNYYINFIDGLPQPQFTAIELNIILFWLRFYSFDPLASYLFEFKNPILKCFMNRISYLPKKMYAQAIEVLKRTHTESEFEYRSNIKKYINFIEMNEISSVERLLKKTNLNFYVFRPNEERK
jgi:hypothetical protein